jgi:NADH-quinone oxidoreductase subunit M
MLVPMYFLIGVWGGPRKLYAAIKFFLYTLAGSVLMLVAILALYFHYYSVKGVYTFDILKYMEQQLIPYDLQYWVFIAFFIGFAIKVPMFPFHTWLPDAHVEAPTAGSVILAGVLLKMGTYGFVRFSLPMFPDATEHFLKPMLILSLIGIIYGALVAMMQKDMKSLVAYSSVSHLGFVMLGVFAATPVALQGGVLQMVNHGISTGALFLIVGIIYERRHTRMISDFGGLSHIMPVYATVFLIMTLSSIGMPGLNGFIGEWFILQGTFAAPNLWVYAAIAVIGIVLGAAYMLWLYQRVMFGKLENPANKALPDLNMRELATFVPLIILAFWIGLYPSFFTKYLDEPVNAIAERISISRQVRAQAPPPAIPQQMATR